MDRFPSRRIVKKEFSDLVSLLEKVEVRQVHASQHEHYLYREEVELELYPSAVGDVPI